MLSKEKIRPRITTNHILSRKLRFMSNLRIRVKFKGSCLKQGNVSFTPRNTLNLFIVYELDTWS